MLNPLKGLGDLNKLRQQALAMQQALAEEEVVVEQNGVRVVMSGDQKIKELTVDGQAKVRIAEAVQEALRRTQQIAAQKLTQMGGE